MTVICPNCNIPMVRRQSKFRDGAWYGCKNYPKCDVTASFNAKGEPLDYPAGGEIKQMRREAHTLLIEVFGPWADKHSRSEMYSWLSQYIQKGHIGFATENELVRIVSILRSEVRKKQNAKRY